MYELEIQGVEYIIKRLHKLEVKEVAKIARSNTRKGNKEIMEEVRQNVSLMVGGDMAQKIADNLTIRAMVKMHKGDYGTKIIIKPNDIFVHESKNTGKRSYIPNAIEYGHAAPYDFGGVKIAAPRPFQRKAYEDKRKSVSRKVQKRILLELIRAIQK